MHVIDECMYIVSKLYMRIAFKKFNITGISWKQDQGMPAAYGSERQSIPHTQSIYENVT
jgi:hypothetical protein